MNFYRHASWFLNKIVKSTIFTKKINKNLIQYFQDFSDSMCHGLGFIVILTTIVYTGLIYYQIIVPLFGSFISNYIVSPLSRVGNKIFSYWIAQALFCLAIIAALVTFIAIDSKGIKNWSRPYTMAFEIKLFMVV